MITRTTFITEYRQFLTDEYHWTKQRIDEFIIHVEQKLNETRIKGGWAWNYEGIAVRTVWKRLMHTTKNPTLAQLRSMKKVNYVIYRIYTVTNDPVNSSPVRIPVIFPNRTTPNFPAPD